MTKSPSLFGHYLVTRKKEEDFVKKIMAFSENLNFILCTLTAIRKPSMALIYNSPWIIKLKKNYDSFSDQASRSTVLNCPSVEERTWLLLAEVMIT